MSSPKRVTWGDPLARSKRKDSLEVEQHSLTGVGDLPQYLLRDPMDRSRVMEPTESPLKQPETKQVSSSSERPVEKQRQPVEYPAAKERVPIELSITKQRELLEYPVKKRDVSSEQPIAKPRESIMDYTAKKERASRERYRTKRGDESTDLTPKEQVHTERPITKRGDIPEYLLLYRKQDPTKLSDAFKRQSETKRDEPIQQAAIKLSDSQDYLLTRPDYLELKQDAIVGSPEMKRKSTLQPTSSRHDDDDDRKRVDSRQYQGRKKEKSKGVSNFKINCICH